MTKSPTPNNSVEFGWGARPMKEQHPILSDKIADHFDKDNVALMRLSLRGYLTDSQRRSCVLKITKRVGAEIRAALEAKP